MSGRYATRLSTTNLSALPERPALGEAVGEPGNEVPRASTSGGSTCSSAASRSSDSSSGLSFYAKRKRASVSENESCALKRETLLRALVKITYLQEIL